MSKLIRRAKKLNSDTENHFIYEDGEVAKIGPVPYDGDYDFSKNGASYITEGLYFSDNNFFPRRSFEGNDIKHPYKI